MQRMDGTQTVGELIVDQLQDEPATWTPAR